MSLINMVASGYFRFSLAQFLKTMCETIIKNVKPERKSRP